MPLIRFTEKEAEGFVILATHGEGRAYRGGLMTVSSMLLKQVEPLFAERGVRYEILNTSPPTKPIGSEVALDFCVEGAASRRTG